MISLCLLHIIQHKFPQGHFWDEVSRYHECKMLRNLLCETRAVQYWCHQRILTEDYYLIARNPDCWQNSYKLSYSSNQHCWIQLDDSLGIFGRGRMKTSFTNIYKFIFTSHKISSLMLKTLPSDILRLKVKEYRWYFS